MEEVWYKSKSEKPPAWWLTLIASTTTSSRTSGQQNKLLERNLVAEPVIAACR
jgi:hypothetical protein